ncbi:MAG TPA: hypothetical protein ENK55_06775 [Actinobacteria bacterium]|nr:hypothetical protein [Actinomycetota bacterium]
MRIGGTDLGVVEGDITTQEVDAVVNAANERLAHGGGVALAIARAAGPELVEASRRWVAEHGPVRPGRAAVTPAGAMPARIVVHVVGPVYSGAAEDPERLEAAVRAALEAAAAHDARSVALPAISAGIYGYPLAEAARVIVDSAARWVREHPDTLDEIRFVGYDAAAAAAFAAALGSLEEAADPDR